jgi:uncharacterized protein YjiS (DUF1127 family)
MSDRPMTRFDTVQPSAGRVGARHLMRWLRMTFRTFLTRQTLPRLTPRELADIGVSSSAALSEAARLPWDTNPGQHRPPAGIMGALERARSRRLIARMSAHELRDIGLSPSHAPPEAIRFFWPG